ncbi:protein YgfX [Niveibacterium sp. SC-1]|uniref:protein YgfX n=1 Tax=Niveibacterium sp. SC-1 TaxID=3135646 RepID=UPI00311DCEB9
MPVDQALTDCEIEVGFSRSGAAILAAFHLVALLTPWVLGLPPVQIGLLALLNVLALGFSWRALRKAADLCFRLPREGVPELRCQRDGGWAMIATLGDCRDSSWMVTLVWRELATDKVARAVILRDACTAKDWRKLRTALRWGCLSPARSSDAPHSASAGSPES